MGPHTKSEVKTASPTLPARHATRTHFFLNLTSDIETLGGYLAFPMLEQVINYVVVVGRKSQDCNIGLGAAARVCNNYVTISNNLPPPSL